MERSCGPPTLADSVRESERLTRLLDNVLAFSKIEQGKKNYHLAPTSLVEVVHTAARALEYPLAQLGFELRLGVEDNLPVVNADGDALQQAILNLVTNAMNYTVTMEGVDIYNLVDNSITPTGADKVAA